MSRNNFRVKVNLSNYYKDVRRSSWVYVDKGEITCICHLQKHIEKLFAVQGAFHLLLEPGEYLPPNEDARVLKENETILVVPGTGLEYQSIPKKVEPDEQVIPDTSRVPLQERRKEDASAEVGDNESSGEEDNTAMGETTSENTVFLSMINNNSTMENESKLKAETSTLEESSIIESSSLKPKRKRVRRRKVKMEAEPTEFFGNGNGTLEPEHKKPKIISSVAVTNGKHIRFEDIDKQEFQGYDSSASTDSRKVLSNSGKTGKEGSSWDKPAANFDLASLLALRKSSTPLTFFKKEQKEQEYKEYIEKAESKESQSVEKNRQTVIEDYKKYPLMANKARMNDVITFKMLKIGNDYTPQVSGNISARVIQILSDGSSYSLKIIHGKDEIQAPQGKFDLETEETENNEDDVITLSWSQLIEPRLIYRE